MEMAFKNKYFLGKEILSTFNHPTKPSHENKMLRDLNQ